MITTPEQMREAANNDEDLIRRIDAITVAHQYTTSLDDPRMFAEMRAIPIAPQPSENRLFDPDSHWGDFIRSAVAEAEKAMRKYPQPNYVITKVAEEAGEVVKAAVHAAEGRETLDNVRGEMLQLVAMLFRLWLEGDQVHGLPPVSGVMAVSANTTAPQPVAVTVKPLVDYILQDDLHNRLIPRIVDIAYLAWSKGRSGKNNDDGGPCDWVNDTKPLVDRNINKIRAALTIQPADPLSDPRVKALVEAATKIASLQKSTLTDVGSAHSNRGAGASGWMREDDRDFMRDLENAFTSVTAAIRAIGGEA